MGLFRDFFELYKKKHAELSKQPPEQKPEQKAELKPKREPQILETVSPLSEPEIAAWAEQLEARATYSAFERDAIERYIEEAFGPIARTYYDADDEDVRVDIAVTEPTEERRFYTLLTIGMGAHRMQVPKALEERNAAFAELSVCLPPDWDFVNDGWPFHLLKTMARFPFRNHSMLGVGNAYHGALTRGSGFAGAFVIPAATQSGVSTRLMLPGGKIVNYYLLLPLWEDEWRYIIERRDAASFWEHYTERIGSIVVDPERESCVDDAEMEEEDEWNT